jgi:uncharacterized protein YjbI with pentapeptide repeats
MNIEIKNRFSGEIIASGEYPSIKEAVEKNIANLGGANLGEADLRRANLRGADLREADLRGANLREADLGEANLDFSCLSFSCGSLKAKTDERQRIQLAFHFLSWIANAENKTPEEIKIYNKMLSYANRFHREDVERLEKIK